MLLSLGCEFLLYLLNLLSFCLLGGVPTAAFHLFVDAVAHLKSLVECGVECCVNVLGAGFYGAVHIKIEHTLGGEKKVFHNISVVHVLTSLNKTVKISENLLIFVYKLLYLLFECGVAEILNCVIALGFQKFEMTECVFDILKFFG